MGVYLWSGCQAIPPQPPSAQLHKFVSCYLMHFTIKHRKQNVHTHNRGLSPSCFFSFLTVDKQIKCVVMPLHEWATGSLPPAGRPPTRQVGPSEVHVSV